MWCFRMPLLWQRGILTARPGPFAQSTGVTSSCEETSSFCWGENRKMEQARENRVVCVYERACYACVHAPVCVCVRQIVGGRLV